MLSPCPTLASRGSKTVFWESGRTRDEQRECGGLIPLQVTLVRRGRPQTAVLPWPNRAKVTHFTTRGRGLPQPIPCAFALRECLLQPALPTPSYLHTSCVRMDAPASSGQYHGGFWPILHSSSPQRAEIWYLPLLLAAGNPAPRSGVSTSKQGPCTHITSADDIGCFVV
jgi:hypothetical protein